MKEITAFFLTALLLIAALAACGRKDAPASSSEAAAEPAPATAATEAPAEPDPATPEGAMAEILGGVKEWDAERVAEYLPEGGEIAAHIPEGLEDTVSKLLSRTEYEVLGAETDGEQATVRVKLTAVDAEKAMEDAAAGLFAEIAMGRLRGETEEDYGALIGEAVRAIDVGALPTVTETATAHMRRDPDGEWKLDTEDERNLPLLNAATGGAVDAAKKYADLAAAYGISLK